ncbi:MAG: diguanylate cyclase [Actinomycetes bacterium]
MPNVREQVERQRMGRLAAVAGPVLAAMMLATMPLIGFREGEVAGWATAVVPTVVIAAVCAWVAPWRQWSGRALLAVPLFGWGCLTVLGVVSDGRASVYAGYSALLFLFVGMTQPPLTSLPLLPLAVVAQLALYGGLTSELAVRMPISVSVWVATAETVARYRVRTGVTVAGLEVRAQIDPLTGCDNRYDLERRLRALRPADAVMLLDLDHFKGVNDTAGHAVGDQLLRAFGAALRATARSRDQVIRYGGEEFLVLLQKAGVAGALSFDERLRAHWGSAGHSVTFSTGICVVEDPVPVSRLAQVSPETVGPDTAPAAATVAHADEALYRAKRSGRNHAVVWSGSLERAPATATQAS